MAELRRIVTKKKFKQKKPITCIDKKTIKQMRENIKELILGLKKIENPQMRRIRMQQIKQMQKELQQYVGDIWTG